jgi:hypothetical protein
MRLIETTNAICKAVPLHRATDCFDTSVVLRYQNVLIPTPHRSVLLQKITVVKASRNSPPFI